ncbi:MAG: chorismate-binding protein [Flavobacteriales bacterium]|nr:chorismate-binding protein [Flavobacteriales bacterium]
MDQLRDFMASGAFGACISLPDEDVTNRTWKVFLCREQGQFEDAEGAVFHAELFSSIRKENVVTTREMHSKWVKAAVDAIRQNAITKVVVSRFILKEFIAKPSTIDLLVKMMKRYSNACLFYIRHPEFGEWIGASPELLLSQFNHEYTTYSLAGTQKFQHGLKSHWSEKLIKEQQLVTDFITDRIQSIHAEQIRIDGPLDYESGPLVHLRTKIQFTADREAKDIADILHPTSAVCGMPRLEAKSFIEQNETHDRGLYTGYFGWSTPHDHSIYYVALRCMQILPEGYGIYVGGGITDQSDPEEEWMETEHKSRVMLDILE